jgi:hypothetical protein
MDGPVKEQSKKPITELKTASDSEILIFEIFEVL